MAARRRPTLVVVSGPPGSGKTTLARELAIAIACPMISRDEIKEGMVHAHGPGYEAAPGDALTARTLPLFFDLVKTLVDAGVTVVAEAAFRGAVWQEGLEPLAGRAELRLIRCNVDPAVAAERKGRRGRRHAHADGMGLGSDFEYLALPAPSVDVDTTDGYDPELSALVAFVEQ